MQALSILLLVMWLTIEIIHVDMLAPKPKDPYRLDRWRKGEKSLDE